MMCVVVGEEVVVEQLLSGANGSARQGEEGPSLGQTPGPVRYFFTHFTLHVMLLLSCKVSRLVNQPKK